MREHKYKCWDTKKKEMSQPHHLGSSFLVKYQGDRYVYIQYTGLKDKNGKEIYEEDIVQGMCLYGPTKGEKVRGVFKQGVWGHWGVQKTNGTTEGGKAMFYPLQNFTDEKIELEVLGNIYENKDLTPPKS